MRGPITLASEFTGTLRVVGHTYASSGARHLRVQDVDTGEYYTIYPMELIELMQGTEFSGRWRATNKGGSHWRKGNAVKYLGDA